LLAWSPWNPKVPPAVAEAPAIFPDARTTPTSTRSPVLVNGGKVADAFLALRDCADCPEMVALPGGTFTMGSPSNEKDRGGDEDQVSVVAPRFAISRFPVTRGEYAAFVAATGRAPQGGCYTDRAGKDS
jgi:formylglycine-generating enzyme required for sulfatase activity